MTVSKILISCNAKDIYLTRICIASIRYYYKNVEIYLIKDRLRGNFDTSELEDGFNVKIIDLGISKFGWGTAKLYFLLSDLFPGERILVLDSDIVFIGRVLDYINDHLNDEEFAISCDKVDDPYSSWMKETYYDLDFLRTKDPDFTFPGYSFNTGQMVITTNKISRDEIAAFVDLNKFPYWKHQDKMPMVDQSLLNYILPKKEKNGELSISKLNFMIWSGSLETVTIDLNEVKKGNIHQLIHWAGDKKSADISVMTSYPILQFFEDQYYRQIRLGQLKKKVRLYKSMVKDTLSSSARNSKKLIKSMLNR